MHHFSMVAGQEAGWHVDTRAPEHGMDMDWTFDGMNLAVGSFTNTPEPSSDSTDTHVHSQYSQHILPSWYSLYVE